MTPVLLLVSGSIASKDESARILQQSEYLYDAS